MALVQTLLQGRTKRAGIATEGSGTPGRCAGYVIWEDHKMKIEAQEIFFLRQHFRKLERERGWADKADNETGLTPVSIYLRLLCRKERGKEEDQWEETVAQA